MMIPPALLLLIRLHVKALFRRMIRRAKGVKGVLLSILGGLVVVIWLGSTFVGMFAGGAFHADIDGVQKTVPVVLLAFCVMSLLGTSGGKGILFTAAETDFLFPGPFSRRQILLYRFIRRGLASLFGALIFGTWMRRNSVSWTGTYVVAVLVLLFFQAFGLAASLAFMSASERLSGKAARRVIYALTGAAVFAAIYLAPPPPSLAAATRPENSPKAVFYKIRDSGVTQALATPFKPFGYALTAQTWAQLVGWSAVSALILAGTLGVALWLDADYLEVSANTSAKLHARMATARQGKISVTPTSAKWRVPEMPRLGGAGAIFWRQATTAIRSARIMIVILLISCSSLVPLLIIKGGDVDPTPIVFSMLGMLTMMGGQLLRFDFRADIDRMDTLKALPIPAAAIVAGQLASPVILMVMVQALMLLGLAAFRPSHALLALGLLAFAPLVSLLFTALENLAFLLFPMRVAAAPGDLTVMARNMINFIGKFVSLGIAGGLAAGLGWIVGWLTGSRALGFATTWVVGAAIIVALMPALAWAFKRFDISADVSADA
jgi:hypothetical protein